MRWHNGHHSHGERCTFQSRREEPQRQWSTIRGRLGLLSIQQIHDPLHQTGGRIAGNGAFVRQTSHYNCRNCSKPCGYVAADIIQRPIVQNVALNVDGSELHSRVNGGTNGSTQRIPHHVIKPLKERLGTMLIEILPQKNERVSLAA